MTISGTSLRGGTSKQSFMLFLFSIFHHHQERLLHSITHSPSSVRNDDLWYVIARRHDEAIFYVVFIFYRQVGKMLHSITHSPSSVRNDEYISISPKATTHQQRVYSLFRLNVPYQRLKLLFLYLLNYFSLRIR